MKNLFKTTLFVLFSLITLSSCKNNDDENYIKSIQKVKIDSVKIAQDTMDVNTVQTLKLYSTLTKTCEGLYNYDYVKDGLTRTVTSYSYKNTDACGIGTYVDYGKINFNPIQTGIYVFKFWNGTDSNGANIYITKNIVVQ